MTALRKPTSQGGFTLLEVLIAIVVLTFGLLGVAGLMLATVQNSTVAAQRTTATFLAQDMVERVRQNINATKPLAADGTTVQPVYYVNSRGVSVNCYSSGAASGCSTRDGVANQDLFNWLAQVSSSLPGGEGIVCRDITPDDGSSFDDSGCDGNAASPWVIKVFWVVREQDGVTVGTTKKNVQRYAMMIGGT